MIFVISLFLLATVAIAAFVLAPRIQVERILFDKTPDQPAPFGYRMAWLAVRTVDAARVAQVLHLTPLQHANWQTGIGTIYDERLGANHVFITPPVAGWTFVVGLTLPQPLGPAFADKCTPMLLDLAAAFPQAQYYLSYPLLDCYAWARVADGKLVRAFAVNDEGVVWNKGRASKHERALGLRLAEIKGVRGRPGLASPIVPVYPTESHVVHLAGCWSVDPTTISIADTEGALGCVCAPPAAWRPERLRRTA